MASLGDSSSPGSGMAGSINAAPIYSRVESYEAGQKKCISDVRRTFCLFVTFDLLFITMLWIIELNVRSVCVCVIIVDCFPLFCRADTLLLLLIQSRSTLLKNLSRQSFTDTLPTVTSADPFAVAYATALALFIR